MIKRFAFMFLILATCRAKSSDTPAGNKPETDTLKINGFQFIRTVKDNRFYSLISPDGAVIIEPRDYYFMTEFPDLDGDGYTDIRIHIASNTPNQCDNYLFDPVLKTFHHLENNDLAITRIEGTTYFYSYERAGCSSMNWTSYLSKIENLTEVKIGRMMVSNCNDGREGIEVYRVQEGRQELVERLSIANYTNNEGGDYFRKYWIEKYKDFE